jgi:membrane-associated protease RseP (regulator of RpoE activity)
MGFVRDGPFRRLEATKIRRLMITGFGIVNLMAFFAKICIFDGIVNLIMFLYFLRKFADEYE